MSQLLSADSSLETSLQDALAHAQGKDSSVIMHYIDISQDKQKNKQKQAVPDTGDHDG